MDDLLRLIKQHQRFCLVSHVFPDGDAVGSLVALQLGLLQLSPEVTAVLSHPVPQVFEFLVSKEHPVVTRLPSPDDQALCIALDLNESLRTGQPETIKAYAKEARLGLIDHHLRGEMLKLATASLHRTTASSTAELVYELLIALDLKITPAIATALLTGIYTDTGAFRYSNTGEKSLEISAELMKRGANLQNIVQHLTQDKSVAALKLLGLALKRSTLTENGLGAVAVLSQEDLLECQAKPEDISGIVGELKELPGISYTLLLSEIEPGILRGSLRSSESRNVLVSRLAKLLGGGGHPRAAGFTFPGKLVRTGTGWQVAKPDKIG